MKTTLKSLACVAAACLLLTGCAHAPSIDIIGSFFPAWMFCVTAGVILALWSASSCFAIASRPK